MLELVLYALTGVRVTLCFLGINRTINLAAPARSRKRYRSHGSVASECEDQRQKRRPNRLQLLQQETRPRTQTRVQGSTLAQRQGSLTCPARLSGSHGGSAGVSRFAARSSRETRASHRRREGELAGAAHAGENQRWRRLGMVSSISVYARRRAIHALQPPAQQGQDRT
jgi:hypothetical protein